MATKPPPSKAKYTHQRLSALTFNSSARMLGITTNDAISARCKANMPALRRSNVGSINRLAICRISAKVSRLRCSATTRGTKTRNTRIPIKPNNAVTQKMPDRPMDAAINGPRIIARIKDKPMLAPIVAIALVRFSSAVRSATIAIRVLAIAPIPCSARPIMSPCMLSANAATTLPRTNINSPPTITGERPILSDRRPRGICKRAWVNP